MLAVTERRTEAHWLEWWAAVEEEYMRRWHATSGNLPAKIYWIYWLYGEMLDRLSWREGDAEQMFCNSYAQTGQGSEYVKVFRERGEESTAKGVEGALARIRIL